MICSTNSEQFDIPTNSGIDLVFCYSLIANYIIYAEDSPSNGGQFVMQIPKIAMVILTMIILTTRTLTSLIQVLALNVFVPILLHS
jgi:hypothetical protein